MILLPVGQVGLKVRRTPWATCALLASCLLGFLLSGQANLVPRADLARYQRATAALEFQRQRPELALGEPFERVFGVRGAAERDAVSSARQTELDRLVAAALEAHRAHPLSRWGVDPARPAPTRLVTYMFLHAGWLHLLSNLLLLYLAGPFIEDAWGRLPFLGLYFAAGIVAALVHVGANAGSPLPLVGASGAIAGVMGAFLVRYARVRIRFVYMIGVFMRGSFQAPAWLMLVLWFLSQLALAALQPERGVAHSAHVGGFVIGVSLATLVVLLNLEPRRDGATARDGSAPAGSS